MGLMDFLKTPEGQGLLSATFGGLAGARRGQPLNSIGRAGMAGLMGYSTAQEQQAKDAAMQDKLAQEAARKQALASLPQNVQPWAAAGVPIGDIYKQTNPVREPQLVTVAGQDGRPMQKWVTPGESTGVDIGPKGMDPTEFDRLLNSAGITDPTARQAAYRRMIEKQSTHAPAPSAVVNLKQETEESKTVGKAFGDMYSDIMKADISAPGRIAKYDRLGSLLEGVNTGKLTPIGTDLAAYAKSVGLDVDPNLGNKQAAEALSNQMALELRNTAGGAGMPGALSDQDRKFLVKMTPGLGNDPAANRALIETAKKLAQRDRDVARIAREYRKKNGHIDEGFYQELSDFSTSHPLFSSGQGSSRIDELVKKYAR
jgi:hypothetical protein